MTGMAREHRTRAGIVHLRASSRGDGDFHIDGDAATLDARRRAFVDRPWSMLLQSHGTDVVLVDRPGAGDRDDGDIAVVTAADAVVGVWTADCAPLVIVDDSGVFAGVHAGWRGLAAGVIDVAVAALAAAGASGGPPPTSARASTRAATSSARPSWPRWPPAWASPRRRSRRRPPTARRRSTSPPRRPPRWRATASP